MPKDDVKLFGKRLLEAMELRKKNAATLSRETGIDESALSRYKKGEVAPNRTNTFLLARALGVNPSWLLGFSNDMLFSLPEKDRVRNELENLLEDMDQEQLEKTLKFVREYIIK